MEVPKKTRATEQLCQGMAKAIKEAGVNFLAIDFDNTFISFHTSEELSVSGVRLLKTELVYPYLPLIYVISN